MNASKLRGVIVANNHSISSVAKSMGIDRSSLYRKLNDFERFTIGEVIQLKDILKLSDEEAIDIFLKR